MAYTWEDVQLGIDVQAEGKRKEEEAREIERKQLEEQDAASAWSFGLSLLGGAIFGPAGYALGKIAGRYGADAGWFEGLDKGDYSDWEAQAAAMDVGKFHKGDTKLFKEGKAQDEKTLKQAQTLNTLLDLGTMYVQAGGLTEGFGETGWKDFTTFGTGGDAWTVFGEGTWADKIPGAGTLPGDQAIFAGGGKTIFEKGGLKELTKNLTKGNLKEAWAQDKGISNISTLGQYFLEYLNREEEEVAVGKPVSQTFTS